MKPRILISVVVAVFVALLPSTSTGTAAEPTCHGVAATYVGTPRVDRITTGSPDLGDKPVLVMLGGDDHVSIDAAGRRSLICLGPGEDRVKLRHTTDRRSSRRDSLSIFGSSGADRVRGRVAKTSIELLGGGGADVLEGGNAGDRIHGGGGEDRIFSTRGDDRVSGEGGDDIIVGGDGNDRLEGNAGDDFLDGDIPDDRHGADRGLGGKGSDRCTEIEIAFSCKRI